MEQLQATVQSKTAVPTAQVYVSFNGEKNQLKGSKISTFITKIVFFSEVVFEKYMFKKIRRQKLYFFSISFIDLFICVTTFILLLFRQINLTIFSYDLIRQG